MQHKKIINGTVIASSQRHNLFESDSCVLFLSAQMSSLGNILKAQKSFEQMFGFPNYIGRNIHSIIPNSMIQEHQQQIKQYLYGSEKKYASTTTVSCALAKNQENFAVPVNVKATIDHVSAFDQIGFVCTISLNYDISNCMLIQKDTYSLQIVSKQFYHTFLKKTFDLDEIPQINASKIFPQIPTLVQNVDTQQIQIKDTLMILPSFSNSSLQQLENNNSSKEYFKSSSLTDKILKWSEQEIHSNNKNFNYYHVFLEIQYTKNNDFPCFIISVKNSQKICNMYEIQPLIQQLQAEYTKFNYQTSNFEIESLNNIQQQSTRIGYSELFQFNENNSVHALYQQKNSISNVQNQVKTFKNQKTLFQDVNSSKVEEIISSRLEQKDSPFLNISKKTHVSLIQSPQNTNQELSHLIYQDIPSTYRQNDREFGQISTRQNLDASKAFTPKYFDEDLLQRSERKQIKQLPEKFWKSPSLATKTSEKTLNKQNRLSRDIIKRLQAFQEGKLNESTSKKKDLENTQIPQTPNIHSDLNSISNNMGQTILKNSITSFHHNNMMTLENQKSFQNIQKMIDLNQFSSQQVDQQEFYDQVLSEKQQNQGSSPKVRFQDNQSNNSNQADNGIKKNYQQSSLVSSSNSTKEALKQVERKIMTTQNSLGLRLLNLFGLVSVISISLAIILQGLQITLAFDRAQVDFNFVSWPMDIASSMSQIQIYITQYYMVLFQLIPGLTKRWTTVKSECMGNIKILNDEWTNLWIAQIDSSQQYTPYFHDTINREINWSVNTDVKSKKDQLFKLSSSEFYFVQNYLTAYKSYPLLQSDSYNQQAILINNYQQYFEQANYVKEDIQNTSITSLKSITSNAALLMYLCISLSLCMLIFIFPIYAYLQFQNEQIYRLMSTLNANCIIQMSKQAVSSLSNFQFALQQYKDIQKLTGSVSQKQNKAKGSEKDIKIQKQLPTFTDNQKQLILKNLEKPNKKKTISTCEPLKKFSFCMLLLSIIVFAVIITLPIVSYFLINNFQEEAILNVQVLSSLYDLKNSFSYSYYLTLGNIYYSLNSQQLYKGYFFGERIPSFFKDNSEKLSNVLQIVSQSSARKRYDDQDYQKFFYQILKADVCSPINNYPQFVNQNQYNLDLSQCSTLRGGILTKGYQTAAKFFFDSLQSVNDLISLNKNNDLKKVLRGWEYQFDIPNFNIYFRMTIDILSILKDFMKGKGDKYLQQMQTTEKLVSVFEIVILFLLFIFWWVFFYRKMQIEMNENRRFLSLLDVSVVVENTYMLTYLSKIKIL
ncbi:transmembrane protein, putative (macronuclear) [Tetrahymena thermophila SB210]|uniref:Transmembrane protein, putative n=1 Tax=Tetrahymena thermophila (strain SB210) TaxID=312017 RepID=I7MD15_TETTS|nr:transmembrane protein, putative [Tetrahymena thermophila SB210]EAR85314.2 transmembrane protein, putative [Tetrahymena thermophila SB210]|eukprot:XP_001032977.2 transmembrane protein, putative [Tetrahymena thermophila SB210]